MPERKVTTRWFTYDQNNSGGMFKEPAFFVIVEAKNAAEADSIVPVFGVYFDGLFDCRCCGNRWYPAYDEDGQDSPQIYGMSIEASLEKLVSERKRAASLNIPFVLCCDYNGKMTKFS